MGDARPVLLQLMEEKLLVPGAKKLYVSYYRKRVYADLLSDGSIRFKDTIYISPVPCALQMKRTLNPSLKTDAGWSTMFSAASGESLKDIKDRLNIRKRGPNSRTVNKDKKAAASTAAATANITPVRSNATTSTTSGSTSASSKESGTRQSRCGVCRKDTATDAIVCTACKSRTHIQCAQPPPEKGPAGSWFCDQCLTDQADSLLDFLRQARRVVAAKLNLDDDDVASVEDEPATLSEAENDKDAETSADASEGLGAPVTSNDDTTLEASADSTSAEDVGKAQDATETKDHDISMEEHEATPATEETDTEAKAFNVVEPLLKGTTEERFVSLLDQLIHEVSSKSDRTDIITNSTGATLVHLAKTRLVSLVERGLRDVEKAAVELNDDHETDSAVEDDDSVLDAAPASTPATQSSSAIDELLRLFDLRHQVLQSKSHFEKTTAALATRATKRLREAELDLMELEEARTVEANAVTKIANLIDQYTNDLRGSQDKLRLNQVLLESITRRRKWIRSTNLSRQFVPAYRFCAKQMITSSDQLLVTVLLDKLRDVARLLSEWNKMETHFETMSSTLQERLDALKIKREVGPGNDARPVPLFARVKIPPSRRLLERQIANYAANMKAIGDRRVQMRRVLRSILDIARAEHLSSDVVDATVVLLRKCGEEDEVIKIEEESDEKADSENDTAEKDENDSTRPEASAIDDSTDPNDRDSKRQRTEGSFTASDGGSREGTDGEKNSPVKTEPSDSASSSNAHEPASAVDQGNSPKTPALKPTQEVIQVDDSDSGAGSEPSDSPIRGNSLKNGSPGVLGGSRTDSADSVRVKKEMLDHATRAQPASSSPAVTESSVLSSLVDSRSPNSWGQSAALQPSMPHSDLVHSGKPVTQSQGVANQPQSQDKQAAFDQFSLQSQPTQSQVAASASLAPDMSRSQQPPPQEARRPTPQTFAQPSQQQQQGYAMTSTRPSHDPSPSRQSPFSQQANQVRQSHGFHLTDALSDAPTSDFARQSSIRDQTHAFHSQQQQQQQQQQPQQYHRFQEQQQQQVAHRNAMYNDVHKTKVPTPQDLFGGPTSTTTSNETMPMQSRVSQQRQQAPPTAAQQHQVQHQQHSYVQHPHQPSQQMLHHAHHMNTASGLGHQAHPMVNTTATGATNHQFHNTAPHAAYYGENAHTQTTHHMMHNAPAPHDVFGTHNLGTAPHQHQQQLHPHALFQPDVARASVPADFQAHFGGGRMFRDPNDTSGMDPSNDMSEWQ